MNISDEDLQKAIDRIARTEDGHLLYRYFQKVLCRVESNESALPSHEGRRRFAAELMGLMAEGISERSANAAVTFAVAGPRRIAPARGAGRRVTLDTPVAGYDTEPSPGNPPTGI